MRYILRLLRALWFPFWFTWDLAKANALVAWEVVTPRHHMRPGIIAVPLRGRTDLEVTLLANLVTFTPGTLSLEVSEDRSVLYVHGLHVHSPDRLRAHVGKLEQRLLDILR